MVAFAINALNEYSFSDIVHAKKIINNRRQDYNGCRPHSALNYQGHQRLQQCGEMEVR